MGKLCWKVLLNGRTSWTMNLFLRCYDQKERYKKVLAHLQEIIHLKNPEMWVIKDWVILHENAPAHTGHYLQNSNLPSIVLCCFPTHQTLPLSHHYIFTYFRGWRANWRAVTSRMQQKLKSSIKDCVAGCCVQWFPETFQTVLWILVEAYSCSRAVFWR